MIWAVIMGGALGMFEVMQQSFEEIFPMAALKDDPNFKELSARVAKLEQDLGSGQAKIAQLEKEITDMKTKVWHLKPFID